MLDVSQNTILSKVKNWQTGCPTQEIEAIRFY